MPRTTQVKINSSEQALKESMAMPAIWSKESQLSQRILIYIASLLEKPSRKKRKPTAWQIFLGKALKSGKTIQEAGKEWKSR